MNRKKKLLKNLLYALFIVIVAIPFIDWNKKNKTQYRFNDITFKIYRSIPTKTTDKIDLMFEYCDTVSQFINNNPIGINEYFNCDNYKISVDTSKIGIYQTEFIDKIHKVAKDYRRQENIAQLRVFLILIISIILYAIIKSYIDKKYKDDVENK